MTDLKVTQLSDLAQMPASDDLVMVVDISDTAMSAGGTNKKVTANYLGRSSGAVIYAQDGKALTLSASGTAVMLDGSGTLVTARTIAPTATGGPALALTPPTNNGTFQTLSLTSHDNGASLGTGIVMGRNTNAVTPAGGHLRFIASTGTSYYVWVDAAGLLRIHTGGPTSAADTVVAPWATKPRCWKPRR